MTLMSNQTSTRDHILNKLRGARKPFQDVSPITERLPMMPMSETGVEALSARFTLEAEKVSAKVHAVNDDEHAIAAILNLIGADKQISGWDVAQINVTGLKEALEAAGISYVEPRDGTVRVGLTGVSAAIAATGSLVVASGEGKPRSPSLVPPVHIGVLRTGQIVSNLEAWLEIQRAAGVDQFRAASNVVIITGSSRTADIAQELIQGAHGPIELHVILITG